MFLKIKSYYPIERYCTGRMNEMATNNTVEHRAEVVLPENERTDKPIRFRA